MNEYIDHDSYSDEIAENSMIGRRCREGDEERETTETEEIKGIWRDYYSSEWTIVQNFVQL